MPWHLCPSCGKVVDVDPYVEACPECGVHIPVPPHECGWGGPPPPPGPPMGRMYGPPGYVPPGYVRQGNAPSRNAPSGRPPSNSEDPEVRNLLDKNAALEEENARLKKELSKKKES